MISCFFGHLRASRDVGTSMVYRKSLVLFLGTQHTKWKENSKLQKSRSGGGGAGLSHLCIPSTTYVSHTCLECIRQLLDTHVVYLLSSHIQGAILPAFLLLIRLFIFLKKPPLFTLLTNAFFSIRLFPEKWRQQQLWNNCMLLIVPLTLECETVSH